MLCFWLLGLSARRSRGAGRLDGIDWNERHGKQFTDTLDIVGAGLTGEEAIVADAVSAESTFAFVRSCARNTQAIGLTCADASMPVRVRPLLCARFTYVGTCVGKGAIRGA